MRLKIVNGERFKVTDKGKLIKLAKANKFRKKEKKKHPIHPLLKKCFYESREWKRLRNRVIDHYGRKCMICDDTRGKMQVDHILPKSKYKKLTFEFNNLQILCRECNLIKSDTDFGETADFRFNALRNPVWKKS
jgi:hypothetical protein